MTGNEFLAMCSSQPGQGKPVYSDTCLGYVSGIYEAYVTFNKWELIADTLCPPETANIASMVGVSVVQLQKQAEKTNANASDLILNSLADAFPCNN